jgi:hypothetical protein
VTETTTLPTWDDMSELDRGAALMHVWKRDWEGSASYAVENYPCEYIEDETLIALDPIEACRHAVAVADNWSKINDRIGEDEVERLYNRALSEGRVILESRMMWAARHRNGNISTCTDESQARFLVMNPSWRCDELLHRTEVGGEWSVVFDARGLEQDCPIHWVLTGDLVYRSGEWIEAAARARIENTARDGAPEHNGHDVQAGTVFHVLDLVDGSTIRHRKSYGEEVLDLRIRRGEG